VIAAGPKVIFLEKPPTCSLAEMDEMVAAARAAKVEIVVSYSRHWAPHVVRLQQLVAEGLIGEVKRVVAYTGGAFLSFGSHSTDLICQFAGYCPTAVYARGRIPETDVPKGYEVEPHIETIEIEFANGVRGTQLGCHGEHGGFYVDVFGSAGYVRAGIYTPPFARDDKGAVFPDERLAMPPNASVFTVAYEQIAAYLDGGPKPHCSIDHWTQVNEIGFAGIESVHTDARIALPNTARSRPIFANG
jgi:predicted dehydrogenase